MFKAEGQVMCHAAHEQQFLSQTSSTKQTAAKGQVLRVYCAAQQ